MPALVEAVRKKVRDEKNKRLFDDNVLDAMKMADQFAEVKPEEYILPLDAMAGFKVATRPRE